MSQPQRAVLDEARPDLDALFRVLLPLAKLMLRRYGEFLPFAASMSPDGQIAHVAGDTGEEHPPSAAVLAVLAAGLRERTAAGELRAIGICYDARLSGAGGTAAGGDAICADLEHACGDAVTVAIPYRRGWFGRYCFAASLAMPATRRVFAPAKHAT